MFIRKMLSSAMVAGSALLICAAMTPAQAAPMTLQTANNATGNQAWSGVGVKFSVNSAITVSALGIWDSNQDGITASPTDPLSAFLLTGAGAVVSSATFDSTSQGTLDVGSGGYRFKSIPLTTLLPGDYVLAGYGWTDNDLEHNCSYGGGCDTFNTGGGLLTYLGSPFGFGGDAPGTLPTFHCCGDLNFFSAANLQFTAVPLPTSIALLGVGLLVLASNRRKALNRVSS